MIINGGDIYQSANVLLVMVTVLHLLLYSLLLLRGGIPVAIIDQCEHACHMYCNAYIKNQLTEKTENIPVIEASFNIVI